MTLCVMLNIETNYDLSYLIAIVCILAGKFKKTFDITTIGNYIVAGVLARGNPLPHAKGRIISEKKYYLQFSQKGNEIFEGFLP